VYDRTTPIEMTQVNPQPAKPALDTSEVPDIDDFSHITLHQVKYIYVLSHYCF